jgi:organic hydroperoxide reductase OsmC/OhrA
MTHPHTYTSRLSWQGSTGVGYDAYDRTHRVATPPADGDLVLSSDPAFRGSPSLRNPEQLLLAAASSCQLLSFLAMAARSRIDVVSYDDDAEAVMPEDVRPVRITRITLRPRIVLADGADLAKARKLVGRAHDACYIANTVNAEVVIEPVIEHARTSHA